MVNNFEEASRDLGLTEQEQYLYGHHLSNVANPVQNDDGSHSTFANITAGFGDKTYLLPTIWNGQRLSADDSIAKAKAEGLDKYPSYGSVDEAQARYDKIHQYMERDNAQNSGDFIAHNEVAAHEQYERDPGAGFLPPWSSVERWIGKHLIYDPDPDNPNKPHVDFGGQAEKTGIPRQWMINGKLTLVSPEEARKYAGEPGLTLQGPNADEANNWLTSLRINSGISKDQKLPDVYVGMARMLASGKSWDEINTMISNSKKEALANGYANEDINRMLSGLPMDGYVRAPNIKPDITENVPDWMAVNLRRGSEIFGKWVDEAAEYALGPRNSGELFNGMPNVGGDYTAGGMLRHIGWDVMDFVHVFGALPLNGAAALAEFADGKERNAWEKLNLAWEAKDFLLLFALKSPGKGAEAAAEKGAVKPAPEPPIPSHQDFFTAATKIANDNHPAGITGESMAETLRAMGDHFRATGEHPLKTAQSVNSYEDWLGKWREAQRTMANNNSGGGFFGDEVLPQATGAVQRGMTRQELLEKHFNIERIHEHGEKVEKGKEAVEGEEPPEKQEHTDEGDGAKPASVLEAARQDIEAQDKVVPPEAVETGQLHAYNDPDAKWRTLMSNDEGSVALTPRRDIEPEHLFKRDPEIARGLISDLRRHFSPQSIEQGAGELISWRMAQNIQESERGANAILRFGRVVGELSTAERWKYIDAIESNDLTAYKGTVLGDLAREIRNQLDYRYNLMQQLDIAPDYVEGYLKHLYANPDRFQHDWVNKATAYSYSPMRTMAGGKSFLRERVFGSYKEARAAGMIAATDNPITMSLMAMRNMDRYIATYQLLQDFKKAGSIKTFKKGDRLDPDMRPIAGQLGLDKEGQFYAPRDIADKINSLTETGLQKYSTYRLIRGAGNELISLQLSASGYHWFFVTNDTFTSKLALAAQQLSRGFLNPTQPWQSAKEIMQGIKTGATAIAAPLEAAYYGTRMKSVLSSAAEWNKANDELKDISKAWIAGGGRMQLPDEYRGTAYGDFAQSLMGSVNYWSGGTLATKFSGYRTFGQQLGEIFRNAQPIKVNGLTVSPAYLNAIFSLIPRTLETVSAPLMGYYVPMMKRGVFYTQMKDAMRLNPEMGEVEMRHVANTINKSIDNRLGELVYDNRFWNKTLRDVSHVMVRAVGWNVGDAAELGGGLYDAARLRTEKIGTMRSITPRTAYVLGTIANTMMLGATVGIMNGTWSEDWGPMDYLFPKTASGLRIAMPTYGKDVYNAFTKPGDVINSKINPLWPTLLRAIKNRDWNGAMITDFDNNGPAADAEDYLRWLGHQALPISVQQQVEPTEEQEEINPLLRFIGINPAPWAVRNPEGAEKVQQREEKGARKKYQKQKAKREGE